MKKSNTNPEQAKNYLSSHISNRYLAANSNELMLFYSTPFQGKEPVNSNICPFPYLTQAPKIVTMEIE